MTEKITFGWANKIRERLEHCKHSWITTAVEENAIMYFIQPILEYAEAEEKKLNEEFEKRKTEYLQKGYDYCVTHRKMADERKDVNKIFEQFENSYNKIKKGIK